ncbi:uncharacterized protein LODBEIA_P18170 [Lodderomyces beijingensis]|uniref:Cdc23 domain-containing protein n=1 Tax=Lodderomyces beijingensis TaxID=1775926 RepID=A0ABP0ZIY5_9ASCO
MALQVDVHSIRKHLLNATTRLTKLQLYQAAKWSAEALNGLRKSANDDPQTPSAPAPLLGPEDLEDQEKLLLAQAYFNCKEFQRAAQVLEDCKSGDAIFLKLYSTLISIDKRDSDKGDGLIIARSQSQVNVSRGANDLNTDQGKTDNHDTSADSKLTDALMESESYLASKENAFLYYFSGMVYKRKKLQQEAQRSLYQSLLLFPYNWSCWKELIDSFTTFEEAKNFVARAVKRNDSLCGTVMFQFFEMTILQEAQSRSPRLFQIIDELEDLFPKMVFVKEKRFLTLYKNLQYFEAEAIFDEILIEDPLRLDGLDTYSNMLYVMEKKAKLSYLAQYASQVDKLRPETCCVLANYYSINSDHEKSIMYYRRALMLDKDCLSAWTLMGHEFVELKNSHAAIESYRRAVDTNPKDFRAWYGLGQAYEVLDMHLYALFYYQKATNLQPLDKRMWQALGNCYEKIDQLDDAFKSFQKALDVGKCSPGDIVSDKHLTTEDSMQLQLGDDHSAEYSVEPHICFRLAMISQKKGDLKATRKYMELCYAQEKHWGAGDEAARARIWLAKDALSSGDPQAAYEMVNNLNYGGAHEVEEARAIARDARNRMPK